jgi:branched-chain amino acid transport system ATP-binding protein
LLLSVDDLYVSYGKITAVRGLSLTVGEGEIVALLGPNGAGKSTALRAISGMQPAASGRVTFCGRRCDRWSSDRIARLGLSLVPEGRGLFGELTVEENLRMGAFQAEGAEVRHRIDEVCGTFPVLGQRLHQRAGTLSGGEQQQLAIARALVSAPRLLVIDEMSLGLAPLVVTELYRRVEAINGAGTSILLVEQQVALALTIASRVYFLERGAVVMEGPASQFAGATAARTYLGEATTSADGGHADRASMELVMVPLRGVQTRALQRLAAERGTNVGAVVADAIEAYLNVPAGENR